MKPDFYIVVDPDDIVICGYGSDIGWDLCQQFINDCMQDPELFDEAKTWVVRGVYLEPVCKSVVRRLAEQMGVLS